MGCDLAPAAFGVSFSGQWHESPICALVAALWTL